MYLTTVPLTSPVRTYVRTTATQTKKRTMRQGIKKASSEQTPMKPFKKHNHRGSNRGTTILYMETQSSRDQPGNNRISCDVLHDRPPNLPRKYAQCRCRRINTNLAPFDREQINSLLGANGGQKKKNAEHNRVAAAALTLKKHV